MQKKIKFYFFALLLCAGSVAAIKQQEASGYDLLRKMFVKVRQVQSMKYYLVKKERINGAMKTDESNVKLVRKPFKVYIKQESPRKGLEVLYVEGANNNKALINTNSFPYVSLSLDPMGSTMREEQHHTLLNAGFDYVANVIEFLLNKYGEKAESLVKNHGTVQWRGKECYKIVLENPHFKYITYTVKQDEDILDIADKYKISEYMVLELNKNIKFYNDVKPGQQIKIPNDYAQKMIVYLEKQTLMPVLMHIYDDKGIYEQYEYYTLHLNPAFHPQEFTKTYKDYKF